MPFFSLMIRSRLAALSLAIAAAALAACRGHAMLAKSGPAECTFANPLASGADPWVIHWNGAYYYARSRDRSIWISKSSTLTGIATAKPVRVWSAPASGWNRTNVWAPELHHIDDRWYVYYAAGSDGPPFIHQRTGVLAATSDDPQGQYTDAGELYTGDDVDGHTNNVWAIDLTVGRIAGHLYAVWSGWERNATTDRTPQQLYIAAMSSPTTISGNRVRISAPTASWERGTQLDLEEGPEFLEHDGAVFIIYSTRESWLPDYRLGQLRLASATSDPMRAESWIKSGPVFTGTTGVFGVGHASFTTSPDNAENWIVYHAKRAATPGWNRVVRMQRFGWNADGSPNFGTPAVNGRRLAVPAGECSLRPSSGRQDSHAQRARVVANTSIQR